MTGLTAGRLFRKYVAVLILLVGGMLLLSSIVNLYFSYRETKAALIGLQRQQALAAAARIEQFVRDIERRVRAAMEVPFTDPAIARDQREIDFLRLIRDVPAITEVVQLDPAGRVQLLVSRLAPNEFGSRRDLSTDPRFVKTRIGRVYFSPVYFRHESEPYLTIAVPWGEGAPEVAAAEVDLKAIWQVISRIHVGRTGYAYVVDQRGILVAHPDMSAVLQKRDLSNLPQIRATRAAPGVPDGVTETEGLQGGRVVTSHAAIDPLGWLVFTEQPLAEAFAPLQGAIVLSTIFFVIGLGLSVLASVVLARRMVEPIRLLQEGAAKIGAGELGHRLDVRTGDELESLGEEFNRTAARLEESYANLEQKVEARTRELAQANTELQALGEVSRAVSSTLDLETVLSTIAARAIELSAAHGGVIYQYDDAQREFHVVGGAERLDQDLAEVVRAAPIRLGEGVAGRAAVLRAPVQVADVLDEHAYDVTRIRTLFERHGYRSILGVPLILEQEILGVLLVWRKEPGTFAPEIVNLLQTFASQSVLAIQNARLFREIADKSRQLEVASRHKSEFLASMSHELRTPLNAILGFNEMIVGGVYGAVPADLQEPLTDIQNSGKHLLRLINNVLDLSKIEAGRMELAVADYSVHDAVESVRASLRSLAEEKGLEFVVSVPDDIPLAHGDGGRIVQCLVNLAGNALKFTRQGRVELAVERRGEVLVYRVSDTGIGIAADKIPGLFTEFKQGDATITKEFGGTGLGLSITRRFVELHKGRIWVESEPGRGSTFFIAIPLRLDAETTA
jgi:signal transduction histidine kinase